MEDNTGYVLMEYRDFKILLGTVAKAHGFSSYGGGWITKNNFVLFALHLQKSDFGRYSDLNMKLYIHPSAEISGEEMTKYVKNGSGDIFRRQPNEYRDVFDLDSNLDTPKRRSEIERMFTEIIDRINLSSSTPSGILRLRDEGMLHLLPKVEARLLSA